MWRAFLIPLLCNSRNNLIDFFNKKKKKTTFFHYFNGCRVTAAKRVHCASWFCRNYYYFATAHINSTVCLIMLHLKLISKSLPLWVGFILSLCSSPPHLLHLTLSSCISPSVCDYLYSCQNDGSDVDSKLLKNIPTKWPHSRRFRKCKAESRSHRNKIWPFFAQLCLPNETQ